MDGSEEGTHGGMFEIHVVTDAVPAKYEACWAGDLVDMCEKHMKQLQTIGVAMGAPVNFREYTGEKTCKNCENELNT